MTNLRLLSALLIALPVTFASFGCQELNLRSQSPDKNETTVDADDLDDEFETKIETPLVGEYTNITGLNSIVLQGVGLVVGLDATGGDPPPSSARTILREDMVRRGVEKPNEVLRSRNSALVFVRAYLPPMVRDGNRYRKPDTFDVEVRLPANSDATSLNGGWLMPTRLTEHALVPGQGVMKGHEYAVAKGPILVSTGEGRDKESMAGVVRRGRIPGGAASTTERNLALFLRNNFRGFRNSKRIADRIGKRFFHYNEHGQRLPLAEAKTDQQIELKVHPRYKENYARYLKVIRNIAFRESDVARQLRLQQLESELNDPDTSEIASLRLEAIGETAVPFLKRALKNQKLEVRFHAAMALAYLEDASGVDALVEAARNEPAFRSFAFAALSVVDDSDAHLGLKSLLDETSIETRYGAFRALSILDEYDPFIAGENLEDRFMLHVLETKGEPLVHLTQHQRSEIVLFGADQKFALPLIVSAGAKIRVQGQTGSDKVVISRYEAGRKDQRFEVSPRISDVILKVVEAGASYPDVVQMLVQAERQHNLPGQIAIDALPASGRMYERPVDEDLSTIAKKAKTRVGNAAYAPNMFASTTSEKSKAKAKSEEFAEAVGETGKASVIDTRTEPKTQPTEKPKPSFADRFSELFSN